MLSDFNNIRESCISTKFAQSVLVVITFQFVPDILAIGLLLVHDLEGVGVFINELVGTNNGSECPASTVRAENISELIPAARKIEFESCK